MIDNIVSKVKNRPFESPMKGVNYSDDEVLNITGPVGWTEVIFDSLSKAVG
jgi:hypothetical protein